MYHRETYKEMIAKIKVYEIEEAKLELILNELLEEQLLFKDNTFAYVGEARKTYEKLIKSRRYKNELIEVTNKIQLKRNKRKNKNI
ncbi:hypothetical protein [Carnobacterium inhibens]|uniref:Uncharacterized protein n=1 Tax=Carnobacterium inhibens TaxID=147709 RepID=A0ABR7TGJ0_9LACT|nr:hypothetical protein [Carnobacterium inhibens]MBC9826432.1 hypothetical protein [Carnobacterium inhibens]